MFNYTEIIELSLLLASEILMGIGVYNDIKERKYPNKILASTIILGFAYAFYAGHIMQSITGFVLVNIIGIFMFKHHVMSSGDLKFLSTIMIFISITDIPSCIILCFYLVLTALIIGHMFYKKTGKSILEDLKNQVFSLKSLFFFKVNTFTKSKFENKEEMLENSIPFTLPIFLSFLATIITKYALACL